MISTSQILNLTDSTLVGAFVKADCGRGTIDILWNFLTAIFLSVWTAINQPVSCFDIERPDNFRKKIIRSRRGLCLICLLAPELDDFTSSQAAIAALSHRSIFSACIVRHNGWILSPITDSQTPIADRRYPNCYPPWEALTCQRMV
ncbi:hypothetical protein N7G274_002473 [Stereocaulon virgatum]|uniref:Uncharacterized protein n=1 Tax=Stereocaulon virgatum TaxID=373712 RepID=A0ABR4AFV8_9LECA